MWCRPPLATLKSSRLHCRFVRVAGGAGLEESAAGSGLPTYSSPHPSHLQLIMDQQDQQLEMVSGSIRVLKHMSGRVGEELDEQGM